MISSKTTFGVIVGNRDFFPDRLVTEGGTDILGVLKELDGRFVDDPLDTFGSRAVIEVPGLQELLRYICKNGHEHHTAMTAAYTACVLAEAFETYFGWDVYYHEG